MGSESKISPSTGSSLVEVTPVLKTVAGAVVVEVVVVFSGAIICDRRQQTLSAPQSPSLRRKEWLTLFQAIGYTGSQIDFECLFL